MTSITAKTSVTSRSNSSHHISFTEHIQGKSLLHFSSPRSFKSESRPPTTSNTRGFTPSTQASYRGHSTMKSAQSLPSTPKSQSPTSRSGAFLVGDLMRGFKLPPPLETKSESENSEPLSQRLKAKSLIQQNAELRSRVNVAPTTSVASIDYIKSLEKQLETAQRRIKDLEKKKKSESLSRLNLENAKMSEELDTLRRALGKLREADSDDRQTDTQIQELEKNSALLAKLKREIESKDKAIVKKQFCIGQLNVLLDETRAQLHSCQSEKSLLQESLSLEQVRSLTAEEQCIQFQARFGMLREDLERFDLVISAYDRSLEEIARLKEKYGKLEMQVITGTLGGRSSDVIANVNLADPVFLLVENAPLSEVNNKRMSMSAAHKEMELFAAGTPKLDPTATAHIASNEGNILLFLADLKKDVSQIDTSIYRYLRPNFSSMILDLPKETDSLHIENPFSNWLEITIRGILDSKYYEHLLCTEETGRTPSRLAEFTYAWMGQYVIDESTRQVRGLNWWKKESADQFRNKLMLALGQEQTKKAWELHTFKEFLGEHLALDELGFYLHCRALLFEGPQLATPAGRLNAVQYIPLPICQALIDRIMIHLPSSERTNIKTAVTAKAKMKANSLHLDSGFVLRVLLEFYKREKKCKYLAISQLFATCKTEGIGFKRTTAFKEFRSICMNLNQEFSELEVAKLYRDTWSAGNGTVNAETFFLVLNESSVLFHCLRLPGQWKTPVLNEYGDVDPRAGVYSQCMAKVVNDWKEMYQMLELAKECVNSMGCAELSAQLQKLESAAKLNTVSQSELFMGRNMLESYKRLWVVLMQVSSAYLEANSSVLKTGDEFEYYEMSLKQMIELRTGLTTFLDVIRTQRVKKLSEKIAAQKIQRNWKRKLKRNLNILSGAVKSITKFKKMLRKSPKVIE